MAYSGCFNLDGNLYFLDLLQKKFTASTAGEHFSDEKIASSKCQRMPMSVCEREEERG